MEQMITYGIYAGGIIVTAVISYITGKMANLTPDEIVELTDETIDIAMELAKRDLSGEELKVYLKSLNRKTSD